jgi:hypothetical protein
VTYQLAIANWKSKIVNVFDLLIDGHCVDHINEDDDRQESDRDHSILQEVALERAV